MTNNFQSVTDQPAETREATILRLLKEHPAQLTDAEMAIAVKSIPLIGSRQTTDDLIVDLIVGQATQETTAEILTPIIGDLSIMERSQAARRLRAEGKSLEEVIGRIILMRFAYKRAAQKESSTNGSR